MLLVIVNGCEEDKPKLKFFSVNASCYNHSEAPLERFCNELGMKIDRGNIFETGRCIDTKGEIHYFKIEYDYNKTLWYIGDKHYVPEWDCK